MREQLALRDARVRSGARQIGWKVGFGSPTALRALDIALPLTGFLLDEGLLEDGTSVDIGAWASPVLEPEIAVHISRDVEADATLDQVRESIGALSAAIELADVDIEPSDVHQILARNIFQRHVLLGARDRTRASSEGIGVQVSVDSRVAVSTDNPSLLTGEPGTS
jgi:2-keto-4-pentenoate hydratase